MDGLEQGIETLARQAVRAFPAVTVVVSTRNRGQSILSTLQAVLTVSPQPFELIVVDQSDPEQARVTWEAAQRAAGAAGWDIVEEAEYGPRPQPAAGRLRYVLSPRRGLAASRNTGAGRAFGDVYLFTDDDVVPDAGWVAAVAQEFAAEPAVAGVSGRILPYNPNAGERDGLEGRRLGTEVTRAGTQRITYDRPVMPWLLGSGANMALSREAFEACGGYDEVLGLGAPFPGWEDLDISYRLLARQIGKLVFTPSSLIYHDSPKNFAEQVRTERGYGIAAGAALAKYWRCGHPRGLLIFVLWIWHMAVRRLGAGLLKWRNTQVMTLALLQFYYPFAGMARARRWPIDRADWLFRPEPAVQQQVAAFLLHEANVENFNA